MVKHWIMSTAVAACCLTCQSGAINSGTETTTFTENATVAKTEETVTDSSTLKDEVNSISDLSKQTKDLLSEIQNPAQPIEDSIQTLEWMKAKGQSSLLVAIEQEICRLKKIQTERSARLNNLDAIYQTKKQAFQKSFEETTGSHNRAISWSGGLWACSAVAMLAVTVASAASPANAVAVAAMGGVGTLCIGGETWRAREGRDRSAWKALIDLKMQAWKDHNREYSARLKAARVAALAYGGKEFEESLAQAEGVLSYDDSFMFKIPPEPHDSTVAAKVQEDGKRIDAVEDAVTKRLEEMKKRSEEAKQKKIQLQKDWVKALRR